MIDLKPFLTGDTGRALRLLSSDELAVLGPRLSARAGKLFVRCL